MAGTWAGALELLAFCLKHDVEAWVGSPNGQVYQFHADSRDMGVFLWYHNERYQFIRAADHQEWLERKRQQDEEGGLQIVAVRGGVPGSICLSDFRSASSAKRSQTSSAGASVNGKAGAKLSARQSVKRPAREDGPALDDFASSSSTASSFRAPTASVGPKLRGSKAKRVSQGSCKAKKAQRASGEPWVCNLCGYLADGNAEQIKGKKSRHLAHMHPEVPRSRFDRRKIPRRGSGADTKRSSLIAPKCISRGFSNLDKALVSLGTPWVCGICGFLSEGTHKKITQDKEAHIAKMHPHVPRESVDHDMIGPCGGVIIDAQHGFGAKPGEWQCGFCAKGLPACHSSIRKRSPKYRLDEYHNGASVSDSNKGLFHAQGGCDHGNREAGAFTNALSAAPKHASSLAKLRELGHVMRLVLPDTKKVRPGTCLSTHAGPS